MENNCETKLTELENLIYEDKELDNKIEQANTLLEEYQDKDINIESYEKSYENR